MSGTAVARPSPTRTSRARLAWSGLLSLVIPGLGQVYARSWRLGAILMLAAWSVDAGTRVLTSFAGPTPLNAALMIVLVGALLLGLHIGTAVDAIRRARRMTDRPRPGWMRSTWLAAIVFLTLSIALQATCPIGWRSFSIPAGSSMPTLLIGDVLLADVRYAGQMPERGDVVIFHYPRDQTVDYVKRVIGLPGDHVQLTNGMLYLNGARIFREPAGDFVSNEDGIRMLLKRYKEILPNGRTYYILKATDQGEINNTPVYVVPPGTFFTLGDNRDNSADSRFLNGVGYVPVAHLVGTARVVYWAHDWSRLFTSVD